MISLTRNKKLFYLLSRYRGPEKIFQIARCYISARCYRVHESPTQVRESTSGSKINEPSVLRKRAQLQGESISEYVAALRDLATTCNFGNFLDDALCDQLIEKLHNSKIRERLLAEEKLDLTKAVKTAVRLESVIKDVKSMRESMSANGTQHSSVNAVKKKNSKPYYKKLTGDHVKSTSNAKMKNACDRCGSPKHKANFKSCPALGQTCRKCGKREHYAKVCLADGQPKVHQLEEAESESDNYVLTVDPSDKHVKTCLQSALHCQDPRYTD